MPTDWKSLSHARGLAVTEPELDQIAASLRALEDVFRPLVLQLPHEIEPAIILSETSVQGQ